MRRGQSEGPETSLTRETDLTGKEGRHEPFEGRVRTRGNTLRTLVHRTRQRQRSYEEVVGRVEVESYVVTVIRLRSTW